MKQDYKGIGHWTATMPLACTRCGEVTMAVYVLAAHAKLEADVEEGHMTCGQCEEHGVLRRTGAKALIYQPTREEVASIA